MGHNNLPVTNTKAMEICELPNKELKIAILGKLSELPEDSERQLKENNSQRIYKEKQKVFKQAKMVTVKY